MPSAGFEPATAATKRPQTYALDRAATEVGYYYYYYYYHHHLLSQVFFLPWYFSP
jgi:hypothetical protein